MGWAQLKSLLTASLPALGGGGLLIAAFVDSSFVPLPLLTDLMLFDLSSLHPIRTPFYAAMAALGSVAGCVWIYYLARKGGQVYYRKTQGHPAGRMRKLVEKHPMACVFLPAVAPFPVPFKPFVIAQGVFQVPVATFIVGTLLGRGCLFFFEGFLGARYGTAAKHFLLNQKWASLAIAFALVVLFLMIRRLPIFKRTAHSQTD
ncbi:MAG TPA: VTT domain-containing protein [Candidatus Acidoferrum sp.]|nr:VTT domain-containing protein [Candidatus Acidoferrum sp.]